MAATRETMDNLVKVNFKLSVDDNVKEILDSLKKNKISFSELSNYMMNSSIVGTKENIEKEVTIKHKVHELYFKNNLSNSIKKDNNTISDKDLSKILDLGVNKMQSLIDKIQNDPTDKKLGAELVNIIKTLVDNNKKQQVKQSEKEEPKLVHKKGDVLFYKRMDTDKSYSVGKVVENSYDTKNTIIQKFEFDNEQRKMILSDKKAAIKNEKLSPAFKYKNITFEKLELKNQIKLLKGKKTDFILAQYSFKPKGSDIEKIVDENVKFNLANTKKGLDIKVDRGFSISNSKAYGKVITPEDLDNMKKNNAILLNNNVSKNGKDFVFAMKFDKNLGKVVAKGYEVSYLIDKNNKVQDKAFVLGNKLDKSNIEHLLKGNTITIGKNKIGFASNNELNKWSISTKEEKKKTATKKVKAVKTEKPKRKKTRGLKH
jgi:hypothetical protein